MSFHLATFELYDRLSEDEHLMSRLFRYRFNSKGELHGTASETVSYSWLGSLEILPSVRLTSEVLAIKGVIYPSTNSQVSLLGELNDGTWIEGETKITASEGRSSESVWSRPMQDHSTPPWKPFQPRM